MNQNKTPLISVIIPVYNTEKYVEKCIDSVLNNTYESIEIIIVNNGSSGNIKEIYEQYVRAYPKRLFQIVNHKKNQGLLKARISGVEVSKGEYYAFIDSDDHVSVDYYRLLVNEAMATGMEMVAAKTVYETTDGSLFCFNLATLEMYSGKVENDDLLRLMYECEGKCFSFNLVWNKLYAKSLWEKAYPYLKRIDEHIVMCEDYVFSTIYYALANGLSIVHEAHHYYYKGEEAYTSIKASYEKTSKNIHDLGVVFLATKKFLMEIGRYDELKLMHDAFVNRYYRIWVRNIEIAELSNKEKKQLSILLDETLQVKSGERGTELIDTYSTSLSTPVNELLDYVKSRICIDNIEYISFDIFDTLICRPFFYPSDLFELLGEIIAKDMKVFINFSKLRLRSEESARAKITISHKSYQDVTLDEIYDEFELLTGLEHNICSKIKQTEVELELKYCVRRNTAFDLYQLALAKGKKVIFTSDMYLPIEVIEKILNRNGYDKFEAIFLSSEVRLTKSTGSLYKHILNRLKISKDKIMHIGDNNDSDVNIPQSLGIESIHFVAPREIIKCNSAGIYGGNYFNKSFFSEYECRNSCALNFLGIRTMLGMIANKFYDNPFVNYQKYSDFNADPNVIGYAALGMHMVGLAQWLHKESRTRGKIHFIARDGYLLKQIYEVLYPQEKDRTDYLYVSRKSLIPLMITNPFSFFEISSVVFFESVSCEEILKYISPIINDKIEEKIKAECLISGIIIDKKFSTEVEMYTFINILVRNAYNPRLVSEYRSCMKQYWREKIGENDITFDIGYSGRTERILSNLLGYNINCCYVHVNNDTAHKSASSIGFDLSCYYPNTPLVTGALRELLISEYTASCTGYKTINGNVVPQFEKFHPKYPQAIIIERIQSSTVQFAKDLVNHFGDDLVFLHYRENDSSLLLEYYFNKSQIFDRWLFKIFDFEDDLNIGTLGMNIVDFWNMQTGTASNANNSVVEHFLPTIKDKVKHKLRNHPKLFTLAKKVYHVFKRM